MKTRQTVEKTDDAKSSEELIRQSAQEIECRIASVQAIRETEKQRILTELRLLRSHLSKEHLQTNAVDFFRENLPNLLVIRNEKDLELELDWKANEYQVNSVADDKFSHLYSGIFSSLPRISSGFGFSCKSVDNDILQSAHLRTSDRGLDVAASDPLSMGQLDSFQTPGGLSHRMSVGNTPKTRRCPRNGELLLSVRGSPLGVYKEEDDMDTIQESP